MTPDKRNLAEFDGLKLRTADRLADLERLEDWIDADEAHRGIFAPAYFMSGPFAADPRPSCYALEDESGVVFYVRLSRAARVRIQFAPEQDVMQRRVIRGLFNGMAFLESLLEDAGCEEWIFDTANPKLKSIAQRMLGFTESTHELVKNIERPTPQKEVM
jgi:hypothetical protein